MDSEGGAVGGAPRPTIAAVNRLDREEFVARLGHLYEGSPWIAAEAWSAHPFLDRGDLHRKLEQVVAGAPRERQLALIRAHPDLVGRAALAGTLGPASTVEQAAAGLASDRLSPAEIAAFGELNRAYRERFGFPFVICARENRRASILAGFRSRLGHDPEQEVATALVEIGKICRFRLADAVEDSND